MAGPLMRRHPAGGAGVPARWEPFRELDELQQATAQLMQEVLSGDVAWSPPVDIEETEDAWIVEAELPGVSRDDIHVDVRDNEVAITGEVKERERKGVLRRRTRRVGQFELRVAIPGGIDADALDARLNDGVLTVRVPKPKEAQPRRVEIQDGPA
jgi:HSP20 family protein